jgi:superfamily I DNA and/or RNA helicase
VRHRSVLDYETPIVWVDSEEPEQYVGDNHGRINKAEADLLLLHLQGYINKIGLQRFIEERIDVGIISPYRVQTHYLRQQIRRREEFRRVRHLISVGTVDGFQGQERDIILISLVRSNEHGQIGFLSDLRRMNVAMTRARMKLLIFGNRETLSHSQFYRRLLEYVDTLNQTIV